LTYTGRLCALLSKRQSIASAGFLVLALLPGAELLAQTDPGIRGGPPNAGDPFATLTPGEKDFFNLHAKPTFMEVEAVKDGLGPRFNLDSCAGCHIHPAVGGSSPPTNNPQVTRQPVIAPGSPVPPFLHLNGPIREVRFIKNRDGSPDGGAHDLFTIGGRADAPGCAIDPPDFSDTDNMIFRIPTPVFGAGLIEAITDATIRDNLRSSIELKASVGIRGHLNTNGNDGTVTRFGWKAQNKSLLIFAGEAYNVEMGVTNENFQTEREENPPAQRTPRQRVLKGLTAAIRTPRTLFRSWGS